MCHTCGIACNIPDRHVRVSSVLQWAQLNTLEGVCIPANSRNSKVFQFLYLTNYVLYALLGLLGNIGSKANWIHKNSFYFIFCAAYFGYIFSIILIIVENIVHESLPFFNESLWCSLASFLFGEIYFCFQIIITHVKSTS